MSAGRRAVEWPSWPWALLGGMAAAVGYALYVRPSPHFSWDELTTTSQDLPNTPPLDARFRLLMLAWWLLEPIRRVFGPVRVTSAYRSPEVNAAVGGAPKSYHLQGAAADVYVGGASNEDVAEWLYGRTDLPIAEVVVERHTGHLHVAVDVHGPPGARVFLETSDGSTYSTWRPA